jgi:hypothetical protein
MADASLHLEMTRTASCSSRACHGRLEPDTSSIKLNPDVRLNEYSKWAANDKHAMAYYVLFDERSKKIAGHSNPYQDFRCLACHTNPQLASNDISAELQEERRSGVGCENCHGAAGGWLDRHTRKKEMEKLSTKDKLDLGMKPMGDLAQRAQVCAGCHVGLPSNRRPGEPLPDVNHDLIARGHPPLNFEFSEFMRNMPAHWDEESKRKKQDPGVSAKTWLVGQIISSQAALELLRARAQGAFQHQAPWPEFAEYDCLACHHNLQQPSWRQRRGYAGRTPGAFPWGTWYWSLLLPLSDYPNDHLQNEQIQTSIHKLSEFMQDQSPKANRVNKEAEEFADRLKAWGERVNETTMDEKTVRDLLRFLAVNGQHSIGESNETALQFYFAFKALIEAQDQLQANAKAKQKQTQTILRRMFGALSFSSPGDAPTNFILKLREDYSDDFREGLGQLRDALEQPDGK